MGEIKETIGERIKRLRGQCRLSQHDLDEKAGLRFGTIARIETNRFPANDDILEPVAWALDVSLDYLKTGYSGEKQSEVESLVEARLQERFGSPLLVQECLEEFVPSVRFRGQDLSEDDRKVVKEKLEEYLDWREIEDELRLFSIGVQYGTQ